MPTSKKTFSNWAGDMYIFYTIFHEDFKNISFIKIGHTQSTHKLCLACLLNFTEQASCAELAHRRELSGQKIKMGFIIRLKNEAFKNLSSKSVM